jgi:hypothetical protein
MPRRSTSVRLLALAAALFAASAACSTSNSSADGGADATFDVNPANGYGCLTTGQSFGYTCQSGPSCPGNMVNIQDYDCAPGEVCCGPMQEGGLIVPNDVSVFVDGATFDTGVADAGHDTGSPPAHDSGTDGTVPPKSEAGTDAGKDSGETHTDGASSDGHASDAHSG